MANMITELAVEQQADIQPTIRKWRDSYTTTTDRTKQEEIVTELYQRYVTKDKRVPMMVHVTSPVIAVVLSKIWQPFWIDFLPKLKDAGVQIKGTDSLDDSLRDSLRASLGDSLGDSLRDSLRDSLDDSLSASLRASLGDSLGASLGASLSDSLRDSLSDSLRDSLGASLGASLRDSLRDSLGASLGASLGDSLSDSLDDSLRDSLDDSLSASLDVLLYGYWRWHGWWYSGVSVVDFLLRHFADDPRLTWNVEDAKLWRDCGKYIGVLLPYSENICFIVDNPTRAVFSDANVLSYDHGKAVEYSDGWGYYMIKGVRFEEKEYWQVVNQELTGEMIAKLASDGVFTSDQSEVAISMLGVDNLLREMNAVLISTGSKYARWQQTSEDYDWANNDPTKLYRVNNFRGTGSTEYCIVMSHPSIKGKKYLEWVEPSVGEQKDADLAQAVAFGITRQEYINSVEA